MPARATVFRWLDRNEEFRRRYALARECLIEDLFDELREIAADRSEPIKAPIYRGGKPVQITGTTSFGSVPDQVQHNLLRLASADHQWERSG